MKLKTASAVLLALLFVTGCETYPYGTKHAAGVFIGALLGSEIGRSMDDVDRLKAEQAINQAHSAPIGNTITWNNAESGNSGTVTPTRDGTSASGEYCREFQQTVVIGGKTEEGYGVACRQPDGTWRIREPA
jgi:surface antigen